MTKYLVLFIIMLLGVGISAQNPLLVPFNDHGKWGYCDTLGKLQIQPAYQSASFFYSTKIGVEQQYVSKVKTAHGENMLTVDGELVLPAKFDLVDNIHSKAMPNSLFLVKKKGKYGIFEHGKGLLVPAKYDSLSMGFAFSTIYLLKHKKDATYRRFDPETLELKSTDIVDLGVFYYGYNMVEVVTKSDGSHYELQNNELILIDPVKFAEYEDIDDVLLEEMPDDWNSSFNWEGPKPTAEELGVDRTLLFKDYSTIGLGDKYGFQQIIVAEKDGQKGAVNAKGEVILPFQYDRITFDLTNTQLILEKGDKVGRKLLFTHHPTIEPRYDKLRIANQLRVSSTWSFGVFEVVLNGQRAYVGENAVEYFDFK